MTRPRFTAFVRIRPDGKSDGRVHTDDDELTDLLALAAQPLEIDVEVDAADDAA